MYKLARYFHMGYTNSINKLQTPRLQLFAASLLENSLTTRSEDFFDVCRLWLRLNNVTNAMLCRLCVDNVLVFAPGCCPPVRRFLH